MMQDVMSANVPRLAVAVSRFQRDIEIDADIASESPHARLRVQSDALVDRLRVLTDERGELADSE
jgi:hypothetical protein